MTTDKEFFASLEYLNSTSPESKWTVTTADLLRAFNQVRDMALEEAAQIVGRCDDLSAEEIREIMRGTP